MRTRVVNVFRFHVELDGIIVGGFSEVSGLQVEIEMEEIQEGGVNDRVHHLPKRIKYPNLVFKRGISYSDELWKWVEYTVNGVIIKRNGTIILMNDEGEEICHWRFKEAYPIRWSGPDLNAMSGEIAMETLELVHQGLTMKFKAK